MEIVNILTISLETAIGPVAAVYVLAVIGLNLHFGYTGLLNFGQVGFMLLGAYGVAIGVNTFGLSLWSGFLISVGCTVFMALVLGIPTVRLRADYLAIATIAVAEVARLVYRAEFARPLTNSVYGMQGFADGFYDINPIPSGSYGIGAVDFSSRQLWLMTVAWGMVALGLLATYMLMHSPWGRVIKGIREDEEAVRSLGKNAFSYKLQILVLGGVFGGLAGAMLALHQQNLAPDQFMPEVTFYLWAMLLLGGAARTFGPVLGTTVMWFLLAAFDEVLRSLPPDVMGDAAIGTLRDAFVGLVLVLLIIFRPQGIIGNRKEMLVNVK